MRLDVGCGDRPRGDVNVDVQIGASDELFFEGRMIEPKRIPNFVKADAHYLPFQNGSFAEVGCFHTLEHTEDPHRVLDELQRVANGIVNIELPVKQHERFQCLFVPKKRYYNQRFHHNSFSYQDLRRMIPHAQIRFSYYLFHILRELWKLRQVTPHFLTFLFYSIGSTFFPPIPDILRVTIS